MNIRLMKLLDKYVGFFICVIITLTHKIFSQGKSKKGGTRAVPQKVLFMKFWGLGSILLLTPAVEAMKKKFPDAFFCFLTLNRNKSLCENLHLFDKTLAIEVDGGWGNFLKSFTGVILYLWKEKFDMVIDFEFFTRFSTLLSFLSFAENKAGYHAWETWRGDIHNIKVPFNRYWHIMDNFYNLVMYLGIEKPEELKMTAPFISEEDKSFVDNLLHEHNVHADFVIAHVNASDLIVERRWPYKNFVLLSQQLLDAEKDLSIVFIGTKAEKVSVDRIIASVGNASAVNLAGKFSISQLACLLKRGRLLIANDSGPVHLAVALDVPTVSLFGPETPVIYGPRGGKHKVFFKNLDCSPCVNIHDRKAVHCLWDRPKCMDAIGVEEVYAAVVETLESSGC